MATAKWTLPGEKVEFNKCRVVQPLDLGLRKGLGGNACSLLDLCSSRVNNLGDNWKHYSRLGCFIFYFSRGTGRFKELDYRGACVFCVCYM